jgi:hypothetical protein
MSTESGSDKPIERFGYTDGSYRPTGWNTGDRQAFGADVVVRDCSDEFAFMIGDHCSRCPSSVAQFFSLHLTDATVSELKFEFENGDELFGLVLEAARGGGIAVDLAYWQTFALVYGTQTLVLPDLDNQVTMENVIYRVRFLFGPPIDCLRLI